VTASHETLPVAGPGVPGVALLNAAAAQLDLAGLRTWARAFTADVGSRFTSRSYCFPYALVAWHSAPVGVDIERHDSYPPGFAALVCTPQELVGYGDAAPDDAELTGLWCGKEALAKALGDAVHYDPRRLDSPLHWPDGEAGRWRARELSAPVGHVAWLCWRPSTAIA
jgi:phosphopantetheinyl transferase